MQSASAPESIGLSAASTYALTVANGSACSIPTNIIALNVNPNIAPNMLASRKVFIIMQIVHNKTNCIGSDIAIKLQGHALNVGMIILDGWGRNTAPTNASGRRLTECGWIDIARKRALPPGREPTALGPQ